METVRRVREAGNEVDHVIYRRVDRDVGVRTYAHDAVAQLLRKLEKVWHEAALSSGPEAEP